MIKVVSNNDSLYYKARKLRELHTGVEFAIDKSNPIRYTKTASDGDAAIIKTVDKGDKSIYSLDGEVYTITQESSFRQISIGTVFSLLPYCEGSLWVKVAAARAYNITKQYSSDSLLDCASVFIHGTLEHT